MPAAIQLDQKPFPGETATAEQIRRLAEEYQKAALLLSKQGRRRAPSSWAPCRLSAIQAIELFLNALLLHAGHNATTIRNMQHNLSKRIDLANATGLQLRKLTSVHLKAIDANREYLTTRYGAEMTATVSQINRLTATLKEVADKVSKQMADRL